MIQGFISYIFLRDGESYGGRSSMIPLTFNKGDYVVFGTVMLEVIHVTWELSERHHAECHVHTREVVRSDV